MTPHPPETRSSFTLASFPGPWPFPRGPMDRAQAEHALRRAFSLPNFGDPRAADVGPSHRALGENELSRSLSKTLGQEYARGGSVEFSVCDPASSQLAFELDAMGVAYKDMPRWGVPDRLKDIGVAAINEDISERFIYHRHVRAAVREQDGTISWRVLDPTVGQFFEGEAGAPRPAGGFMGVGHGMGVYTFRELQDAFFHNRGQLDGMARTLDLALANNYSQLSERSRSDLVVSILYGSEHDPGVPPGPWRPSSSPLDGRTPQQQRQDFEQIQQTLRNYYRSR